MASKIPLDIFLEVISHVGPPQTYKRALVDVQPEMGSLRNRTIRSMALVCRGFYFRFFPYLFENVFILHDETSGPKSAHCARFCESIARGDQRARTLAAYVKTYAIAHFDLPKASQPWTEPRILEEDLFLYSKALGFMSNLRELYLFQSSITSDLLHATQSLPPLRVLRIEGCNVPYPLDEQALRIFSSLQTATVYESNTSLYDQDGNASEPCQQLLKHFCLSHTERLEIEAELHYTFLNGLACHSPMLHLQSVHISRLFINEHRSALSGALKLMPNLESLRIGHIEYDLDTGGGMTLTQPETFSPLPILKSVYAPLSVLLGIVPGSLVTSIGIAEEDISFEPVPYEKDDTFWTPVANVFRTSQRPIQELDVPMSFYCNISFARLFPQLKMLTVRPKHFNWYDENDMTDSRFDEEPDGVCVFWQVTQGVLLLMTRSTVMSQIILTFLQSWQDYPKLTRLNFTYDGRSSPLPIQEEQDGIVRYSVCDVSDDWLTLLKLRIPTLQWLAFTHDPPRFVEAEIFEFYLGEQDGQETAISDSEASNTV